MIVPSYSGHGNQEHRSLYTLRRLKFTTNSRITLSGGFVEDAHPEELSPALLNAPRTDKRAAAVFAASRQDSGVHDAELRGPEEGSGMR